MWRKRIVNQTKKPIEYKRFTDFVKDYPPEGLGTNMNALMSLCRFHNDIEAVDLLASVTGTPGNPTGNNQHSGINNNIMDSMPDTKQGTSAAYTMRRLAKDFPAIHARVLAGELTPNKAALEAGFRQPKLQLPEDPDAAGRYLAERVGNDWMIDMYEAYVKSKEAAK